MCKPCALNIRVCLSRSPPVVPVDRVLPGGVVEADLIPPDADVEGQAAVGEGTVLGAQAAGRLEGDRRVLRHPAGVLLSDPTGHAGIRTMGCEVVEDAGIGVGRGWALPTGAEGEQGQGADCGYKEFFHGLSS